MQIEIPIEQLKKRKLFIAAPMYGGQCAGMFARSIADLSAMCSQYGIPLQMYFLFNESLITRARNYCADEFMRSGADHLMFIDSDIGFNPNDVLALLALMTDESPYDVMGGPYPKKCISWEKIKQAVDRGFADKNPLMLEEFVGDYVFNPVDGTTSFRVDEPVEVKEGGTGFMLIKRTAFNLFDDKYPQQRYKPDHVRTEHFDGTREITAYFDCPIDPDSKRYLSEDYMFCQWVRKAGAKVWLLPWVRLKHAGTYIFGGSLQALAAVGASPTTDVTKIGKKDTLGEAIPRITEVKAEASND